MTSILTPQGYMTTPSVSVGGTGLQPLPQPQATQPQAAPSSGLSISPTTAIKAGQKAVNLFNPASKVYTAPIGPTIGGQNMLPSSLASTGPTLAQGAIAAGGTIAGGYAANKVFGEGTGTNVGSAVGGMVGSAFGPVGSIVGSFVGGGIGSMFGNDKPSSKRHTASFDFSNSNILDTGYMEGKYSDKNDKLSKGYANLLGSITSGLGAFTEKEQGVGIASDNLRGLGFSYGTNPEGTFDAGLKYAKNEGQFLNSFFDDFTERFGERLTPKQKETLAMTDFSSGDTAAKLASMSDTLGIDSEKVLTAYKNIHGENPQTMQALGTPTPMVSGRKNTNWDDYMQRKMELDYKKNPPQLPNATGSAAKTQQVQIQPAQV